MINDTCSTEDHFIHLVSLKPFFLVRLVRARFASMTPPTLTVFVSLLLADCFHESPNPSHQVHKI